MIEQAWMEEIDKDTSWLKHACNATNTRNKLGWMYLKTTPYANNFLSNANDIHFEGGVTMIINYKIRDVIGKMMMKHLGFGDVQL